MSSRLSNRRRRSTRTGPGQSRRKASSSWRGATRPLAAVRPRPPSLLARLVRRLAREGRGWWGGRREEGRDSLVMRGTLGSLDTCTGSQGSPYLLK